jgi:hypothetical protein
MELQPPLEGMLAELVDEGEFIVRLAHCKGGRHDTPGRVCSRWSAIARRGAMPVPPATKRTRDPAKSSGNTNVPTGPSNLDEHSGCELRQVRSGLAGIVHGHEHLEPAGVVVRWGEEAMEYGRRSRLPAAR